VARAKIEADALTFAKLVEIWREPTPVRAEGEMSMNLATLLAERAAATRPVRMGLIGVDKFGSMILAQTPRIAGLHVAGVATSMSP
jgi:hypothetical protein